MEGIEPSSGRFTQNSSTSLVQLKQDIELNWTKLPYLKSDKFSIFLLGLQKNYLSRWYGTRFSYRESLNPMCFKLYSKITL